MKKRNYIYIGISNYIYEEGDLYVLKSYIINQHYTYDKERIIKIFMMKYIEHKSSMAIAEHFNLSYGRIIQILDRTIRIIYYSKKKYLLLKECALLK